jgi:hypothetical protein
MTFRVSLVHSELFYSGTEFTAGKPVSVLEYPRYLLWNILDRAQLNKCRELLLQVEIYYVFAVFTSLQSMSDFEVLTLLLPEANPKQKAKVQLCLYLINYMPHHKDVFGE